MPVVLAFYLPQEASKLIPERSNLRQYSSFQPNLSSREVALLIVNL
ncbi:hypothetical protein ADICYQ_5006 [Cyclobacterium qasimii M12-11B]|uniref:Uncharacterized protein n=1 Tax=Cyclobacterium qasimii M12-11B TaxID=641524 RepID=S7V7R7_9BACT|nr:hypothetical protein ADICYQ_5006 [Cyclobacterium qasimii M12-11B]